MFKFIFLVLIVIGAITTVPRLRSRVLPPLLQRLGPVGEKLQTPIKKWESQAECDRLLGELQQWYTQGKPIPAPVDFYEWARKTDTKPNTGKDPWGSRYWLKPGRSILSCGSNGPDTTRNTPDDILVNIPWQ